jgi:AcrR family transcriptional regulator
MARPLSIDAHQLLADAIDEVLYRQGLHEGTIDEICLRANVSKPALYRHFGDRDRLVVDYLRRRQAQRTDLMQAAVTSAGSSSRQRVLSLITWFSEWITSDEFVGCGFHRAIQQGSTDLEDLKTITREQKEWIESLLRHELHGLVQKPNKVARHLFLLVEGAMAAGAYQDRKQVAVDLRNIAVSLIDSNRVSE